MTELQSMNVLKQTLVNQSEQGEVLIALIDRFEAQEIRIDNKITEVETLVSEATKQITINYDEQRDIQSLVSTKANDLAEQYISGIHKDWSDNLFKAWKGLFIRRIYGKIKREMNVVRYTSIKRTDFKKVIEFISKLEIDNFTLRELQPTPSILTAMELELEGD